MGKFIKTALYFVIPAIVALIIIVMIDFFKIWGFQDYYAIQKVELNREMVCTKTYNYYRIEEKYDSYIFGNSRSQAFKCKNWINYLAENDNPFHFDASGESIWGISKKIEYINELEDKIDNALIVLDRTTLTLTKPLKGHLFIPTPDISKCLKLSII